MRPCRGTNAAIKPVGVVLHKVSSKYRTSRASSGNGGGYKWRVGASQPSGIYGRRFADILCSWML